MSAGPTEHAAPDQDAGQVDDGPGAPTVLKAPDVDDLMRRVVGRVHAADDEHARWMLLQEAVVALTADLSIDRLLERIVSIASALSGAEYVALGVLEGAGERRLRTFVLHGMSDEVLGGIERPPAGHGLLGLIVDDPRPLRLSDIAAHPASYGFPAGHPPMRSFLGVPVRTREQVFGNLYLTEKRGGGDFTEDDQQIVVALAAAAGVAIENTLLVEDARRRQHWLAATAEITSALLAPQEPGVALQRVADRAREVAAADAAWCLVVGSDDVVEVQVSSLGDDVRASALWSGGPAADAARGAARTSSPVVLEDLASGAPGCSLGPGLMVPMRGAGGEDGLLVLGWSPDDARRQRELDPALVAGFAENAALSLQVERAQDVRRRLAVLEDRDRIGRDLHDVVIQRLFAIGLSLQGASRWADGPLSDRLAAAVDDLDGTIKDIRGTIFDLGAGELGADVELAMRRVVRRSAPALGFRPHLHVDDLVAPRVGAGLAVDLLAVLSEALSNASRHARATSVAVSLTGVGHEVVLEVEDDGRGLPADVTESGLRNLRQRAEQRGGTCTLGPGRDGVGTRLHWVAPLG